MKNMNDHTNRRFNSLLYLCQICYTFVRHYMADRTCELCGAVFQIPALLKRHQQRKTPCASILDEEDLPESKRNDPNRCKFCGRVYASRASLLQHMRKNCKIIPRESNKEGSEKSHEHMLRKQQREIDALKAQVDAMIATMNGKRQTAPTTKISQRKVSSAVTGTAIRSILDKQHVSTQSTLIIPSPYSSKSKKKMPAALRVAVWIKYIGVEEGIGFCFCCRLSKITRDNFQCGHVISAKDGGEAKLPNLRPICALCNSSMGTRNMQKFAIECGFVPTEEDNEKEIIQFLDWCWNEHSNISDRE